jgi:hypothetical protein
VSPAQKFPSCAAWPERCGAQQWAVYERVLAAARERGIRFAVGGAFAAMTYIGQWRNTKDLDLYIEKSKRDEMVQMLSALGLRDYYEKAPYDREWIYRSYADDTIVDVIWAMANQRAQVDADWLRGPEVEAGGERFRLLPPEELLWSKLYILQHERCDWPDILNLLQEVGPVMNWRHVFERVADDAPFIRALFAIFAWLSPNRARELPAWIWKELQMDIPADTADAAMVKKRARILDSRPWFTAAMNASGE